MAWLLYNIYWFDKIIWNFNNFDIRTLIYLIIEIQQRNVLFVTIHINTPSKHVQGVVTKYEIILATNSTKEKENFGKHFFFFFFFFFVFDNLTRIWVKIERNIMDILTTRVKEQRLYSSCNRYLVYSDVIGEILHNTNATRCHTQRIVVSPALTLLKILWTLFFFPEKSNGGFYIPDKNSGCS